MHGDAAAHQLRQVLRNLQPQAAAAVLAHGGAVALGEALEQPRQGGVVHAYAGVPDRDPQHGAAFRPRFHGLSLDSHRAHLGELDRVAEQIEQDLPQAGRIT